MKVFFLHLPKTAGQTVHAALEACFPPDEICPARVNEQLALLSISELNQYRVFSGHLDWSLLDAVRGPRYVFTVLREPIDRVLSFYFFLRKEAGSLSPSQLELTHNRGLKAALTLTPQEFFIDQEGDLREFLDIHFDNFYTYYFAGRYFEARRVLRAAVEAGTVSFNRLIKLALSNLSYIDEVFTIHALPDLLRRIENLSGRRLPPDFDSARNVNRVIAPKERIKALNALGGDARTLQRIDDYVALDKQVWGHYVQRG